MAITITIPRLGWNMDQGVFIGWLKQDGETIRPGDPLFTLEGEKATQDIEASDAGILRIPTTAPSAGDTVAVGAMIGYLLAPGEAEPVGHPAVAANGAEREPVGGVETLDPETVAVTEMGTNTDRRNRPRISPLARRVARELGVDWTRLRGSGCTGRIRKVDVVAAARVRAEPESPSSSQFDGLTIPGRSVPIGPTRRTIAARMVESRRTTAPVTLNTTADAIEPGEPPRPNSRPRHRRVARYPAIRTSSSS